MTPSADAQLRPTGAPRTRVGSHELIDLTDGWELAACAPGAPAEAIDAAAWIAASVPGTVVGALRAAGVWSAGSDVDLDARDWWFRTTFARPSCEAGDELRLCIGGVATVFEVYLNGELILEGQSMFVRHEVDIAARLSDSNELSIRCLALTPVLAAPRRPRARWRTRLVSAGNLRFVRTMLLGRIPGVAPSPPCIGPWRGCWIERRSLLALESLRVGTSVQGSAGVVSVQAASRALGAPAPSAAELRLSGPTGVHVAQMTVGGDGGPGTLAGELTVEDASLWRPHTHGEPCLYEVSLNISCGGREVHVDAGSVGFRELGAGASPDHDIERDGLDLHVNGEPLFVRGAVWPPPDLVSMAPTRDELRAALELARDAGMNMIRIPGTGAYESVAFHDICDQLGMLVWQDLMFANLDYPIDDPSLRASIELELAQVLGDLAGRPSLAVLCGNSEIEQQVAMLGLDPALGRGELFAELIPALALENAVDVPYLPSSPCGGDLPFRPNRGVTSYYGVGSYRRPLGDARASGLLFASECLALANVPDEPIVQSLLPESASEISVNQPAWKAGVPRDPGTGWDFDDVRDHYLREIFDLDPGELRRVDQHRYLELSRLVSGEVMASAFGEWRRAASPCRGALVLWLKDLVPGAGWGVLDSSGKPKAAYFHLRRALAPVAVWMTDEGLGGVAVHLANDRREPLTARLRLALYRNHEQRVHEAVQDIVLPASGHAERGVEELLGYFVDASWAYRFGPPAQDLIVASIEIDREDGVELLSQAMHFPARRPATAHPAPSLGLSASLHEIGGGCLRLRVASARLAYGIRVHVPGFSRDDDSFSVEPGGQRSVMLRPEHEHATFAGGSLSAVNLQGRLTLSLAEAQ